MIFHCTEQCPTCITPGSQNDAFHSDKEKANLCEALQIDETRQPRECVFFGNRNVQHATARWRVSDGLLYHMHMFAENMILQDAVTFTYEASLQPNVQNKCEFFRVT